jgi:hypothetical protein
MSGIRVFFLFPCAITISGGPAAAQTLTVDAAPAHAVNSFSPVRALGAGVDRLDLGAADHIFTESMQKEILASGWRPVTYRQNTELHAEAWHWNPKEHGATRPECSVPRGPRLVKWGRRRSQSGNTARTGRSR